MIKPHSTPKPLSIISRGATALFALLALALIIPQTTQAQISISSARSMPLGTVVTVKGIVTNGAEFGVIRYMQDNTAGIGIYDPAMTGGMNLGDSVELTGEMDEFNQLLEIVNLTSLTVINSGNPLPTPVPLSIAGGFTEAYEGQLVQINNVSFDDAGAAFATTAANYGISDGINPGEIRINGGTNIVGTIIPTAPIELIGIMGQYSFADPLSGYQLLPRDLADLVSAGDPPVISTVLTQTDINTTGFTVNFETLNPGSTIIYYGLTDALGSMAADATEVTDHNIDLTGLDAGTIYYVVGASVSSTNDTSFSPLTVMATASNSSGVMNVFFNAPVDHSVSTGTNANYLNQAMDDTIIAYLDRAKYTLDIAIYNMDNDLGIVDAINSAYDRGVQVRLVGNTDINAAAFAALSIGSGNTQLSPTGGTSSGGFYGLMHNKFIVIDANSTDPNDPWVWTGSTNWTDDQVEVDKNNAIVIQDQTLARAYTLEFEEMFGDTFGEDKTPNTPTEFVIGGKRVEAYFSPTDQVEQKIEQAIQQADHDLEFAVFTWTRFNISYEVEDAVNRGVFASGVIDVIDTAETEFIVLDGAMGEQLKRDNQSGLMHHKYMLIDALCENSDPMVLTGSSNFTGNGTARSDENILIIHDMDVVNQYYQEYVQRYTDNGGSTFAMASEDCALSLGVAEQQFEGAIKLYPVPAGDQMLIQILADDLVNTNGSITISVVNLLGAVEQVQTVQGSAANHVLYLESLPAGSYLLNLQFPNGTTASRSFIKL